MITKVDIYNAPYEMGSADRFYKDIDTKLVKHYKGNVKDFSYTITSTTEMTLTVNDSGIGKASYARIESSIFDDGRASYWFLTAISEIESDEGTRYTATLDAIATMGEDVFLKLQGKKIKIDRLHEDRYNLTGGVFELNKQAHGLINTDFKVPDTKGVELIYDGANEEKSSEVSKMVIGHYYDVDFNLIENKTVEIDNRITIANKVFYLYALMEFKGSPTILTGNERLVSTDETKNVFWLDSSKEDKSAIRRSLILPVNVNYEVDSDEPTEHRKLVPNNSISSISRLQEGKIINIIKTPYKLNLNEEGMQILFDNAGKRYGRGGVGDVGHSADLATENFTYVAKTDLMTRYYVVNTPVTGRKLLDAIFVYSYTTSYNAEDVLSIPTSKLNDKDIMDFIAKTKTPAEMKAIIDAKETDKLEIGLLNPEIMPIEMQLFDNKPILDIFNFLNKSDPSKILGSYTVNEMGIETTLSLSKNQFAQWSQNTIMSFATDQGKTYLARNKYSNDAQRKAAELNAEMQKNQVKVGQSQQYGGGLLGGFLSMMNPANWAAGIIRGQQNGIIDKVADNKKQQIQASIDDAASTAPTLHTGSSHNLSNINPQEFKYNFNWFMKKPNPFLLNKIVEFYDRHGYIIHDWIVFNSAMIESRSRYNYIEIDEFKDFIGTFDMFDINVLNLLDKELKKGLRLWHIDDISYDDPNLEKIIIENI